MFCLILLCKMRQNIVYSKFSFAALGGGILFGQPITTDSKRSGVINIILRKTKQHTPRYFSYTCIYISPKPIS